MEKLNEYGNSYILSNKKYCKYYSLLSYEQANAIYNKYLSQVKIEIFPKDDKANLEKQKLITTEKIKDINNGAIVLCYESFKGGYLVGEEIITKERGLTNQIKLFAIGDIIREINIKDVGKITEMSKILLNNYEKILSEIKNYKEMKENLIQEAICIANILKLNKILGEFKSKKRILLKYAEKCDYIINYNKDKKQIQTKKWYKEFNNLYEELKKLEPDEVEYYKISADIKNKNSEIFNEIEKQFNKRESNYGFIKFILDKYPYKEYEKDKDNIIIKTYSLELVKFLIEKYHPHNYSLFGDEKIKLQYCINHEITEKLNNIYTTLQ